MEDPIQSRLISQLREDAIVKGEGHELLESHAFLVLVDVEGVDVFEQGVEITYE
jgi:hypothetical protein